MTQGDLEKIALPIQKNLSNLETRIMSDVIRRIKANGEITSAADWQINRLYEMGVSKKAVKKMIAEELELSKAEVKKLYRDALYNEYIRNESLYREKGKKWIAFDKNKGLQELITAVEEQTDKELRNITQSLGFAIRGADGRIRQSPLLDFYQGTLDDAMNDIASGAFDYNTVLNRTIQTMTNSGLRTIDYGSGWSNRVEVAGRRAVMTGFNQLQAKINEQVARELKTDYFEVTWHGGARPEHQVWQGRVYSRKQLETVCGLGSVTGLCGANCYHQYNAFIPGVSVRTYTDAQLDQMNAEENEKKTYNGKEYTTYEALQHQRKMETLMRKQRQDIKLLQTGEADEDTVLAAKSRYRSTMEQYVDFSDKMKLPQQRDRIYMDGLGRMVSGKNSKITNPIKDDIIKIQKADIAKSTTKLKSAMKDEDYAEYLERLDKHQNQAIKKLYVSYADGIADIKLSVDEGYYLSGGNNIVFSYTDQRYVNNGKDKYATLAHEYGHYFDTKCNFADIHFSELDMIHQNTSFGKQLFKKCASSSDEFLSAVRKDRVLLRTKLTSELKSELAGHDASDGIQDAIDGLLGKRIKWGHGDRYYNRRYSRVKSIDDQKGLKEAYQRLGIDASNQAKVQKECRVYESASEMWANIMAAEVNGGESLKYVKEYLPNSYQAMMDILKGVE